MLKIVSQKESGKLLKSISGQSHPTNEDSQLQFLTNKSASLDGTSLHQEIIKFIDESRARLYIEMAFLGNPDFINAITQAVKRQVEVTLVMPERASSNHHRNLHFAKRLMQQCNGFEDYLKVKLLPQMVHSKVCMSNDEDVFEECNLHTKDPHLVKLFEELFSQHEAISKSLEKAPPWLKIILQSRLEYMGVRVQQLIIKRWLDRPKQVELAREECRSLIASHL